MTKKQFEYRRFVGEQIVKKRKILGLSQGKLGERFGVKASTVSSWELGTNPIDTDKLYALSEALGEPISYFVDDINQLEMRKGSFLAELQDAFFKLDLHQQEFALRLLQAVPKIDCHDVLFCSMLLTIMEREQAFDIDAFLEKCLSRATERDQAISKKVDGLLFLRSLRNALAKCGFFPDKIDEEIERHIQAISDCLYQRGYDTAVAENQLDKDEQLFAGREIIEKELTQEYEEVFRNSWTEGYDAIKKPEGYIEPSDWDDYV